MVKVNLIGKKRRETKGKNWAVWVALVVYGGFLIYFFASVIFVVYNLASVNNKIRVVDEETKLLSGEMLKNNDLLNKYVLAKFILGKIQTINKSKFGYKTYLDAVSAILPSGVALKNVDFSVSGWVSVTVSASNLNSLNLLEKAVSDESSLGQSVFSSVFSEGVTKGGAGGYDVKLQFELRKNAGK